VVEVDPPFCADRHRSLHMIVQAVIKRLSQLAGPALGPSLLLCAGPDSICPARFLLPSVSGRAAT